jgi:putative heme degradation protein
LARLFLTSENKRARTQAAVQLWQKLTTQQLKLLWDDASARLAVVDAELQLSRCAESAWRVRTWGKDKVERERILYTSLNVLPQAMCHARGSAVTSVSMGVWEALRIPPMPCASHCDYLTMIAEWLGKRNT